MVTVKCQHSGIEFEAASKRTKQHPKVAEIKVRANKDGNYREVLAAMDAVAAAGGYTTVDEYIQAVRDRIQGKKDAAKQREQRFEEARQREEQKKREFEAWLKANGFVVTVEKYTEWVDNPNPSDFLDETIPVERTRTVITAPDGQRCERHEVRSIFDGKATLEGIRAAQQAKIDAENKSKAEEAEREQAHSESVTEFDRIADKIRASAQRVKQFDVPADAETVAAVQRGKSDHRAHDRIAKVTINGVDCWRIIFGSGYDDDGYWSYWCADPAAAELESVESKSDDTAAKWLF